MTQKKDRSEYVDYPVDNNWRFSVIDEPNDIVIRVDFFSPEVKPNKWHNIARIEQSEHSDFHAHLPGREERISIAEGLSRVQKLDVGFNMMREYADSGEIKYEGNVFKSTPRWEDIKKQMLNREVAIGSTRNTKSIAGVANVTASIDIKLIGEDGKIKEHRTISE